MGLGQGFDAHAYFSATDFAEGGEFTCDPLDTGAWDCESDSLERAAGGHDRGVDADELPIEIDHRAAGVSRVDRRVGLEQLAFDESAKCPTFGADDSDADGLFEGKGAADRKDPVADLQAVGISQFDVGQGCIRGDSKDSDIA